VASALTQRADRLAHLEALTESQGITINSLQQRIAELAPLATEIHAHRDTNAQLQATVEELTVQLAAAQREAAAATGEANGLRAKLEAGIRDYEAASEIIAVLRSHAPGFDV